jgi:gliding motility-associated-like protein
MNMKIRNILTLLALCLFATGTYADISLKAVYTSKDGAEVITSDDFTAEAPLHVHFQSNPSSLSSTAQIEWHLRNTTTGTSVTRYEQDIDYDFVEAGVTEVTLQVRDDNIVTESATMRVTISESHLEMPNAFSPNGDGINDIYRAKQPDGYKSIVEFRAYIFNRWGQKLYEWTDVSKGWDGTYKGSPVKEGVYFVLVKARGADGREYNIKKDVNLLRNYIEGTTTNSSTGN